MRIESRILFCGGDDKDIWRYNEVEEQMYPEEDEKNQDLWDYSKGALYSGKKVYKGIRVE